MSAPERKRLGDVVDVTLVLPELADVDVGAAEQALEGPTLFHLNIME